MSTSGEYNEFQIFGEGRYLRLDMGIFPFDALIVGVAAEFIYSTYTNVLWMREYEIEYGEQKCL